MSEWGENFHTDLGICEYAKFRARHGVNYESKKRL